MSGDHKKRQLGIQAIDTALRLKYPNLEALIYSPMMNIRGGGEDPLEIVAVYRREEPIPHWHFITYGFSDLYEKTLKTNPSSGFGFELTFRIVKPKNEEEPPEWVIPFLQNLAKYVFTTGNRFDNGVYIGMNQDINFNSESELNTIAFTYDVELKPINTSNGILVFLQIVGLTQDEKLCMQSWNCNKFLDTISKELPLFITDISRGSIMQDENIKNKVENGMEVDGSSTESILVKKLNWKEEKKLFGRKLYEVVLSNDNYMEISNLLRWRVLKGRDFSLIGVDQRLSFSLREVTSVYINDFELKFQLNQKTIMELVERFRNNEKVIELQSLKHVKFRMA